MVKVIVAKEKIDCEHLLGEFYAEGMYDRVIDSDTDFYLPSSSFDEGDTPTEAQIGFKFRKNYFPLEEQRQAYEGLYAAATISNNRGLAAGNTQIADSATTRTKVTEEEFEILNFLKALGNTVFDVDLEKEISKIRGKHKKLGGPVYSKNVWLDGPTKANNFVFDEYVTQVIKKTTEEIRRSATIVLEDYISTTTYANMVNSGIAGWYDRYPRIPYGRSTAYTNRSPETFALAFPFLQNLSAAFEKLLPTRFAAQKKAASTIDPGFVVPGTVFTTLTVNKTFQTAFHRDAGDFTKGLSNLLVLTNGKDYSGGYLVLPEYKTAINIRPGDLLLINNHEVIHGNTPIVLDSDESERVSLVCYLREGMLKLGTKEYEDYRFEFVETRKNDKFHKYWRNGWNGVSAGMWADNEEPGSEYEEAQEWLKFLSSKPNGEKYISDYHPWLNAQVPQSLDEFFS